MLLDYHLVTCSDPLVHYPVQSNGSGVGLNVIQRDYIWARTSGGQHQARRTIPGRLLIANEIPGEQVKKKVEGPGATPSSMDSKW